MQFHGVAAGEWECGEAAHAFVVMVQQGVVGEDTHLRFRLCVEGRQYVAKGVDSRAGMLPQTFRARASACQPIRGARHSLQPQHPPQVLDFILSNREQ